MTTDTPYFIELDDVDGGYGPLPAFVTRATLREMLSDGIEARKWPKAEEMKAVTFLF